MVFAGSNGGQKVDGSVQRSSTDKAVKDGGDRRRRWEGIIKEGKGSYPDAGFGRGRRWVPREVE